MVRAKFRCMSVEEVEGYDGTNRWNVRFCPVSGTSEENERFWSATPDGLIELRVVNKDAVDEFKVGGEYYVDFQQAAEPV